MGKKVDKEVGRKEVLESLCVTVEIADEKIEALAKWSEKENRLPEIPSKRMIEVFLVLNKFNIEKSQKKLEMYYKIRALIPELFEDKNPALPNMQKISDVIYFTPLPKITRELNMVNICKFRDVNPKNFDVYDFYAHTLNIAELKILSDTYAVGDVFVFDLEGVTFGHFFKLGVRPMRSLSRVLEEVYSSRVKGIHYINCPRFIDAMVSLVKTVLKPKLASRIHIHRNTKTLCDHISKEILPKDYGGNEKSLEELKDIQRSDFLKHKDRFDKLDWMRLQCLNQDNEARKVKKLEKSDDLRTLSID